MTFIVECYDPQRTSEKTRFVGPFDHKRDAEVYVLLPVWGSSECEGTHTIHEMNTPAVEPIPFTQVVRLIDDVREADKSKLIVELAQNSKPIGIGMDGRSLPDSFITGFGIENKIATIKELRTRYPGLGLKEAKDIVDGWHENREAKAISRV